MSPLASCCCCFPMAGFLHPAGGSWPGVQDSGSPAAWQATRLRPVRSKTSHRSPTPTASMALLWGWWEVAGSIVAAGSLVSSAVSLIVRMRHAASEQRQQIKWLAYGGGWHHLRERLDQSLERAGRHLGRQRRRARVAGFHGHSHGQAPSLRHRPPHKPHSGLRFTYYDADRTLRRRHRPFTASLRRSHRPGGAATTRHSRLDPDDRGSFRSSATAYPVDYRKAFLPQEV